MGTEVSVSSYVLVSGICLPGLTSLCLSKSEASSYLLSVSKVVVLLE
jgi:hypothetical protein